MTEGLPAEALEHLRKIATPAHMAQYVTKDLPDDSEAKWLPFRHHLYMNHLLVEACTAEARSFINMSVSVRMGKSEIISRYLPVWYLGMYPDRDVVIVSNSSANAEKWGLATRNLMQQFGPELFGLHVDPSSASKTEWGIKGRKGTLRAVGIGTQIEGRGIHLGVLDDVIGQEQAMSPTERRKTWDWYTGAYRTRLMPGSTTLLVMSRWHLEDLAGMIEEHYRTHPEGDPWVTVKLPAIAEAPKDAGPEWRNVLGQADGEALWPERWPLADLHQLRESMQPATWESRYQQNPTLAEGGMFKVGNWQRRTDIDRARLRMVRCWDLAATEDGGDWTVGVLMGMDPENHVYILDVQRFRKASAGVKAHVKATADQDGRFVPIRIEQERAGAGKAQIADYKRLLVGFVVNGAKPEGTKVQRAGPFASQQQDSNVWLVGLDPDLDRVLVEEHRVFDRGRHDDIVDACSGAFDELARVSAVTITTSEDVGVMGFEKLADLGFGAARNWSIPVG